MLKHYLEKRLAQWFKTDATVNFGAYARDQWVAEKARALPEGARVLDVGAGQCQYRALFSRCDYRTQDFAEYGGTKSGVSAEQWVYGGIDYVSDVASIPVPDASFDVILCTEVLEHVPEPIAALREFGRIVRPGGVVLLSAPLGSGLHQEPYHFYGGFTPYFYRKFLNELGFEPPNIRSLGGLFKHTGQEVGRVGRLMWDSPAAKNLLLRCALRFWLPRKLYELEEGGLLIEEFTVGYVVEARKKL